MQKIFMIVLSLAPLMAGAEGSSIYNRCIQVAESGQVLNQSTERLCQLLQVEKDARREQARKATAARDSIFDICNQAQNPPDYCTGK